MVRYLKSVTHVGPLPHGAAGRFRCPQKTLFSCESRSQHALRELFRLQISVKHPAHRRNGACSARSDVRLENGNERRNKNMLVNVTLRRVSGFHPCEGQGGKNNHTTA